MKRYGLKTLNLIGYYTSCGMIGFLYGKIMSFLFRGIWTEEVKETKPVLFWGTVLLYYISLLIIAIVYVFVWPAAKFYNWIDSKIDNFADEREWD